MASGRGVSSALMAIAVCASLPLSIARADDDPDQAQFLKSCGACHATEPGAPPRQGPNLAGVFGRKAGRLEGFKYSAALASADWAWDAANLDQWIENAQGMRPGVVMPYRQADPDKRRRSSNISRR